MQEVDENVNEAQVERQQTPVNNYNIISPNRRGGQGKKFLLVFIVLVLVVGGGIFIFARGQGGETGETPTPTPTEIPTPSPTPSPTGSPTPTGKTTPTTKPTATPTKKPTKNLIIRVLNGSGTAGVAKDAADYLGGLGYEIIGTGNATSFDFQNTTIQIKSAKESLLAQLKIDLQTKYTLGTTSATLSATESADAIVTVGKK